MDETLSLDIKWIQGFPDKNVEFVDDKTVCYSYGNQVCFLNLETKLRSVFQSPGYGVGSLTANSKSSIFAFSEQKLSPSIFVYSFPEPQLKNELKGHAQLDYTSLALCDIGPYLASCSSFPDYTITVWNWEKAEAICTQSQAGQDVTSLLFNPLDWFQLCALGTTNLTVWNIDKSASLNALKPRVIELPTTDGSFTDMSPHTSYDTLPPSHEQIVNIYSTLQSTSVSLTPTAICWTATSELYVGCEEGYLLRVDPESYSVSILFNPTSADAIPELQKFNFQALRFTKNGVIAAGKESVVHCLQIKGTQTSIKQTWQLERPVRNVLLSPDTETLLLSSSTGQIHLLNLSQSNQIMKVLDVSSCNFLAASLLHIDRNACVSLRENGVLQLWSSDGTLLSSLSLQVEVTSLACCPVAHYAAVGTASGSVLFIDLNTEEQPRLVHRVYLSHTAVNHVVFDQQGHYLLISDSDSHLYAINAKPSAKFTVIGYMVLSGPILSLSTQYFGHSDEVNVLVLCSEQQGKAEESSMLTVFSLPVEDTTDCVDRYGCLSAHKLRLLNYKVPLPLTSCALGDSEVFAYCQRNKSLQRFELPESADGLSSQQVVQLKPLQIVKGHPLGPASVFLSPDCLWLASLGWDGLLRIRQTASMERYTELLCHSRHLGREWSMSLSTDGHTILTTGFSDGCLVCTDLRIKDVDDEKVMNAALYNDTVAPMLKIIFKTENPILINLPEWGQVSPGDSEKTEESEVSGGASLDVTGKDASPSNLTWLEHRRETVVKEDIEQYSEAKERLRETVRELHNTILKMLQENDSLPPDQFNLDLEEQRRLEEIMEEEVRMIRADIQLHIAEKCYLYDVLKRESWDSWMVKRRALKAFHSEQVIWNYPVKERTEKELEDLRWVQNIRKFEEAACSQLSSVTKSSSEEKEDKSHESENAALTGSISAQLGFSNPYIYDQFSLQATDQRINQIILLQDLIYCIKMSFNTEFEALHSQKVQELKRVRSRNKQIREIMLELDMNQELWEPRLTDSECPERLFTVDHSEIKAEQYLPSEQTQKERRKKLEEEKNLTDQSDGSRVKALGDMMYGVLEVKKRDILKKEIPQPEFVLTKPASDWSEEENNVYKEYMKKTKDINEEKEKCKQSLETEIKRLQESIKDATVKFDEALIKLVEKKFTYTAAICQEELRICHLLHSVFTEEDMRNREQELKLKLEKTLAHKNETWEVVMRHQYEVDLFKEDYEYSLATEKTHERDFKEAFKDVPHHLVDKLHKLYKRRPRIQKMRAQTGNISSVFKEHLPPQAPDALSQMQKAMEELDAPQHMPDGLNSFIWEKFCQMRRRNVENEQEMRKKALTLAEMQAFLQRRKGEDMAAQEEFKKLSEALESLHKMRINHLMNTMVQVRLKQGQVEVSPPDLTDDNTENDIILCHRSLKTTRREMIKTLARRKAASMKKRKQIRKHIIQLEWEHRVINKKTEDLRDKERDIKMLRLSKEQNDMKFCSKEEQKLRMSEQISNLEKSIALTKKTFQWSAQQQLKKIERLNKKTKEKAKNSSSLQQQILDVQTTVAELRNISGAAVLATDKDAEREARHRELVQRRKLEDTAQALSEELTILQEEVNRLRRMNFPCFDLVKN